MQTENRHHPRFEPPLVDAIVNLPNGNEIRGCVLDSSRGGMAIALPEKADLPSIGTEVTLAVTSADSRKAKNPVGSAVVLRNWSATGLLDNGKGVALKFSNELFDNDLENYLLQGIQQQSRLTSQAELATIDIAYLGDYRRDLIACQMKLFVLILTVGVALAGAYFGLTYHSVATNQLANPDLSFWRTMVAALPGCLAISCALMVAQKSISIQRVDAYLLVLKQCKVLNQYPREYKGWESEYRKFRHVLNTNICKSCEIERKCGDLKKEDRQQLALRSFLHNPKIDLYHIVMYMSFFSAFGLSIIAVMREFLRFQLGVHTYMAIASGITITIVVAVIALLYVLYHLRKGWFSVDYFKRCWIDIMNKCRRPV